MAFSGCSLLLPFFGMAFGSLGILRPAIPRHRIRGGPDGLWRLARWRYTLQPKRFRQVLEPIPLSPAYPIRPMQTKGQLKPSDGTPDTSRGLGSVGHAIRTPELA